MADFCCVPWLPAVRRDKINCWGCLKHDFVGVPVDCSHSAMSVLTPNVFETVQMITQKIGYLSASRPNSSGPKNPQPVGNERRFGRHVSARAAP
jgi:hypothetical protein